MDSSKMDSSKMDSPKQHFVPGLVLNDRYETVSALNHGTFGVVSLGKDRRDGTLVAIKCLLQPTAANIADSSKKVDEFSEELPIHSRICSHPNIVNLLDSFETETHRYIVLEYCSMGDLYEAIRHRKGPQETEHVRSCMLQLVDAIEYLHSENVYHRDIKPENIFLTETSDIKLGDFGFATQDAWVYDSRVGSDRYMAPEVYDPKGNAISLEKADLWSIGICLLNILFAKNPFEVPEESNKVFGDFMRNRWSLFDCFPSMSQDTFEVLAHCLVIDPTKRSLSGVKEALKRVSSFTTDDEILDQFCTETREIVTATANREPLRTPSVTSPTPNAGNSFPWSRALRITSPKPRQLPVIADNETVSGEMFPASEISSRDWFSKGDTRSIDSTVESGSAWSLASSNHNKVDRSKPVTITSSLPNFGHAANYAWIDTDGKKGFESRSWIDMIDEDEEEERLGHQQTIKNVQTNRLPTISQADSDDGRSTPRACLGEVKNLASPKKRSTSNDSNESILVAEKDERISEHTGFIFDDHTVSSTPLSSSHAKRDRLNWSMIGEFRRGVLSNAVFPTKPETVITTPDTTKRHRCTNYTNSIRRSLGKNFSRKPAVAHHHEDWEQQNWNKSTDWRRSTGSPLRPHESQLDGTWDSDVAIESEDEWLGGWDNVYSYC